jgi:hypothetical protein
MASVVAHQVAAAAIAEFEERKRWDAFATQHACKKVAQVRGDVQVALTTATDSKGNAVVGVTPITTPDKTAYRCDDGITYWR